MFSYRLSVIRILVTVFFVLLSVSLPAYAEMEERPVVKLQSLDKITARTATFEARVGSTVQYGPLYIKVQACRKAPPMDQPESAAFLQVWELNVKTDEPQWVFSGWMFASSPALSPMDHPIYDVWVLDCLESSETLDKEEAGTDKPENKNADETDGALGGEQSDDVPTDQGENLAGE